MEGFRFLDSSQESNNIGGFTIDGNHVAFVPVHSNGGKNLIVYRVDLKTNEAKVLENIPESKYGKFGGCACELDGANVVLMMSVRGAGDKQRFATGFYPNVATPRQSGGAGVLTPSDRTVLNRFKAFLGIV
jgi:hypothetical protein